MEVENKHRGWQRVLLLIVPYIFTVGFFQSLGALISGVNITDCELEQTSIQQLIISSFDFLGTFFVLWLFMKFIDKEQFIKLGFYIKGRFKDFAIGIVIGLLIMSIGYFLLLYLNEITFQKINFNTKETLITILLFTIVAIVEETLLRGYILRNLMISFNKYSALIISSILFSLMHGFNPNIDLFALTNLFLAGILLGLSYIHTKNLWFPIALHLSWNLFQSLLGFNVSGLDTYSIIEFNISEKSLLNGGAFGFEGSIFSVIAMLITTALIEVYYRKKYEA
ncbi:CPBP family intramembrane metalloprotease [Lutibacter sp. A64]|uniref:CPBP family intramembrane glutamic endopeptidase n=1 Tax=Lutibacter sp. A64 TaxID=2918526 RepID=UPI001F05FA4D|nr:CPBP family intramembrane glutamic endopeptidase [Lutibacter sp. A64]UMB53296.1 CPBP family intramembrane metalloprotease [Lutibacter sp. A64]